MLHIVVLLLLLLTKNSTQQRVCTSDDECDIIEACVNGVCVVDKAGCNPPCPVGQICVAPTCEPEPTPPPPPSLPPVPQPSPASATQAPATPAPTPSPQPCGIGWQLYNGYCYFIGNGNNKYSDAVQRCASLNAKVVWFNQSNIAAYQDELYNVNRMVLMSGIKTYWIGLKKISSQWIWSNDQSLMYPNWRQSQPDKCCGGDVTCVLVNYHTDKGEWEDAGCDRIWRNPQGYVCKRKV